MFVDKVSVVFRAGDGGDGLVSFRREKFRERGGPNGGDGGHGGNIILRASRNENTLAAFRYRKEVRAENGANGMRQKKHGKSGADTEVSVPVGTVISSDPGQILADLSKDGESVVIAKGGRGGYGNAHFVSSTRQAPQVAELGDRGEVVKATLELKMIADAGIIGLPNAGKSTLLSVISNAKPEVADYPFTTLHPNLGVVDIDQKISLLFADIPGLIEGASKGKGLGDEFLRHVERTSVLVHLIDAYKEDIKTAFKTITQELKDYSIDLSRRPQVVALTKVEGFDKKALGKIISSLKKIVPRGTKVMAISSASGEGVRELLRTVAAEVEKDHRHKATQKLKQRLPVIGLREDDRAWHIKKSGDRFVISGKKIEQFAGRTRFGDFHAQQRLRDIMHKMGITAELNRRGIQPDQTVVIGDPPIGQLEW